MFSSFGVYNILNLIEKEVLDGIADAECYGCEKNDDVPEKISEADAILAWHHLTYDKYEPHQIPSILHSKDLSLND